MKIGDYVRTKKGYIRKIIIEPNFYQDTIFVDTHTHFKKTDIVKSSPNIIDLIEVGDIINYGLIGGGMVLHKENGKITTNTLLFGILENKDIKTIITKEQIESMQYKIGEN